MPYKGLYGTYEEYDASTGGSKLSREQYEQKRREKEAEELADFEQNKVGRRDKEERLSEIRSAITQPQQYDPYNPNAATQPKLGTTTPGFGIRDNTALISDSFESQKNSALASLKAAIQKAKGGYQSTITSAPETFRPLKEQTTVASNRQLSRLRETMAEQGQAGGVSRSEETAVGSERENRLNALEQQQRDVINNAQSAISELEASGQLEEAKIVSENANNRIRAILEESNRVEQLGYERSQDELANRRYQSGLTLEAQRYADQQAANKAAQEQEQSRYTTELERRTKSEQEAKTERETAQKRDDFAATINPKEDITAKIQALEKQGVNPDDYRIVEYKKARINKIANMDQANFERELANIKAAEERLEAALAFAWKKFNAGLPADPVTAKLIGVNVGQIIPEQSIKDAQLELDKIKTRISQSKASKEKEAKPIVSTPNIRSQIDKNVTNMIETRDLDPKDNILRQLRADEIIKYSDNGQLTDKQAMELIATYGLTQSEIEQAERRRELISSLGGN